VAKWIDAKALDADIDKFSPAVNALAALVPGQAGNELVKLLESLESSTVLNAVVDTINTIDGAQPSAT
jgi:hypothetical protein